ncbi:receptor-type tyrosine-protein phosphatase U isoform X2 [Tachyglossus aculeatus]|uniref:receptor-type tyrosine-protein phosphatase U isoform X2 n=1 Tax=Tachyglossus aculeatus TaxID=9261 RepID=UPI0018F318D9|nr:receptor-type tyrosine-protein phosphatase U isoform X2 [Tachyglossus aculeatus]
MPRALALLLALTLQLCASDLDSPPAGCTFEEDESEVLTCGYSQADDDDFQWELVSSSFTPRPSPDLLPGSYLMVNASRHTAGQRARVLLRPLSENDTHCLRFSYLLSGPGGHSPGSLRAFVRVNGGPLGGAVWELSGSHGHQWHQAELAVSTFWPSQYQVLFEAEVAGGPGGFLGLDDILLLKYPCLEAPHFSRLADEEVNAGQNASFQCTAVTAAAGPGTFLLQRQSGPAEPLTTVQSVSARRLLATFRLDGVGRAQRGSYRCLSQAPSGAGVSNFAQLLVREPPTPAAPPQLLRAGPTYLLLRLNAQPFSGDGPVVRRAVEYRPARGAWAELHPVSAPTYRLWHLDPDTRYHVNVLLTRPGEGGTGRPGPTLVSRTKCAEPMRAPRGLAVMESQPRQLHLQWEPLGYNVTRCHAYTVALCYRYTLGGGHNETFQDCAQVEPGTSQFTIRDLPPHRHVHVRLTLSNPEGRKEGRESVFQTDEDVPGGIMPESLTFAPLEDAVILRWAPPVEPNGIITEYEISSQSIESSDPTLQVPGQRSTVSKLHNETFHVFVSLLPGTTYLVSVRARTARGFGRAALAEITTNISVPSFDYADMPPPLAETEDTITVLLRPARGHGAPISLYQVVVEEERPRKPRNKPDQTRCFPAALPFSTALARGLGFYTGAELPAGGLQVAMPFTVGDNGTYGGYWNPPLEPRKAYLIHFQATSHLRGDTRLNCVRIARKAACKDSKQPLEVAQGSEEVGLVLGICVGALVGLILLLGVIVFAVRKGKPFCLAMAVSCGRHEKACMISAADRSFMDQSTLQDEERPGLSYMDTLNTGSRGDLRSSLVNEASGLLGGSLRRSCGRQVSPYPTGQLHPAIRVADLLQHIRQMKTAEGYGFKQEYESFFEGWDIAKKREKAKGRQEQLLAHERHRVKLHPLLGDPNSDYINANYVDGYHRSNHFIATQGPKQEMVYDFWRMVWQEHCSSIVMITKLVEVGRVKCWRYWPDVAEVYGDIKLALVDTETLAECVVRTFTLERRGYSARHEIRQFHFTSWPDHGVPYHATGLLAFIRRVKASTPPDAGPVVVHCSAGTGRTGCYIVLDVMLDMAECEGVVDIYNCVRTLGSRRCSMIQTEEQYVFVHDAILEACLCGETAIAAADFQSAYRELVRLDSQANTSQLREEFQTLNSVTPALAREECSVALLPRNQPKNRGQDVLPPDRCLPFLVALDGDTSNYINASLVDSYTRSATFIITPHPLPGTTTDFWRLVFDYGSTTIVMLNQLNPPSAAGPCLQYWPDRGLQQFGPMEVEFLAGSADENLVTRLFRVRNCTRLQEGHLTVRHYQFLSWPAFRETPESAASFLRLLTAVEKWRADTGEGRTVVHCLTGGGRSGTFCACAMVLEMIRCHSLVDVFFAAKMLRNYKPNLVETLEQYHFCYDFAREFLLVPESR